MDTARVFFKWGAGLSLGSTEVSRRRFGGWWMGDIALSRTFGPLLNVSHAVSAIQPRVMQATGHIGRSLAIAGDLLLNSGAGAQAGIK